MKMNQLFKFAIVAFSFAVAGLVRPTAHAQSAVFQQNANGQSLGFDTCGMQHFASNTNLWTRSEAHGLDCNNNSFLADVSNWDVSVYPNGATFNVTIPPTFRVPELPQGAHLNESVSVGNLTINAGALLSYDANNSGGGGAHSVNLMLLGGTLTNNGTLKSIGPQEAGQTYTFAVNTLLTGSGTSNFGYATTLAGPGILTIASAQSVIGGGNVTSHLPLVNHGVITADGSSGFFGHNLITFMDSQITNTGTIQTTAGGAIQLLENVTINNTGGTLRASSSDRFNIFSGAEITGGTLVSSSDDPNRDDLFYINTATLNGIAIATGTKIRVDGGILTLNGAIANNGQINFANTQNPAGTGRFNIASDTTLSGTGSIVVNGSQNTIADGKLLTLGAGQSVYAGFTNITGAITNHGLINAGSDRGLFLYGGNYRNDGTMQSSGIGQLIFGEVGTPAQNTFTIDNTGGAIRAIDNSTVHFNGDILVRNGGLSASVNSTLSNESRVTLENVTVTGLFHNKRACFGTVTLQLAGSLTNNGQIDDLVGECNPININLLGDVSIDGNGSFVLYRGATITSTNGGVLTNGPSHTIGGNFTITSSLVNNGEANVGGDNTMNLAGPSVTNNGTLAAYGGAGQTAVVQQAGNSTLTNYDPASQTLNGGTYLAIAAPFGTARLSLNIGPVVINNATIILSGAGAQFDPINSLHENWGTLSVLDGKIFSTAGPSQPSRANRLTGGDSLANAGTLKLDERSTINVNGNYTQGSNAILYIEIGADGPNPNFHQLNVSGTAALAGTLNVRLVNGFTPAPGQMFPIINATGINGGFTQVHGADVTYTSTGVIIHPNGLPIPPPVPNRLLNISTRMRVLTDPNQLIGGFIITGAEAKRVIILATGPSLSAFGIPGVLADPILELYQGNSLIASNDNWKIPAQAEIEATHLQPTNDLESALVRTLTPGAYTAIVRGTNNGTGVGLVQIFDLGSDADSKLANISSRGFVEAGDNVMIAGLILGGDGVVNSRVVVRALGPSLNPFLSGALQDPTLDLKDANGATLVSNDDWRLGGQQAEIEALGLAPTDDREAALVTTLPNASYTAIVRGKNNTTGVALVDVYNVE